MARVEPQQRISCRLLKRARRDLVHRLDVRVAKISFGMHIIPRLNVPMRLVDHAYFVAEHDDHHLARIWGMRGAQQVIACGAMRS